MIPTSIRFPPQLALARAVETLPGPDAMPGGRRFEPKWDGIRLAAVADSAISLWSRQGTDLTAAFPEIVEACGQLPTQSLFDGELVLWKDGRLAFEDLLRRMSSGVRSARRLAREMPASLVLFDVLAIEGVDTRRLAFDERRELLTLALDVVQPPLSLSPMTADPEEAAAWFEDMAAAGIEGLMVKGGAQPYRPGERDWVKVKRRETVDVVVAAVIGSIERPQSVVVGLVVDGKLRVAGRSASLKPAQATQLGRLLRPPSGKHPWPEVLPAGGLGRFSAREGPVHLTLVEPVAAEVSADSARSRGSFRHSVRFLRLRSDAELPAFE